MKKIATSTLLTLLFIFVFCFSLGLGAKIGHSPAGLDGALMIATWGAGIGLIAFIAWGVPVHLFFIYKGIKGFHWYFISGLLPGFVIIFVFNFFGNDSTLEKLLQSVSLGLIGSITATVFYIFVREKNAKK
ncbi:hypothetical protein [Kangiella shandongensis]|uniref:hypothetical protein n=1 Tax=Kangiella shandongensis TaxID=2763258 RepID=UPI001CBFD38E|nr:hypothetical protein [Kangiella shandongensis]